MNANFAAFLYLVSGVLFIMVLAEARSLGIEVLSGQSVVNTSGKLRISSISVARNGGGAARKIAVDALLVSAGWTPSVHLFSQSRGKVTFDAATERFLPGTYAQECLSVGACNGTDDLQATIDEALAAGELAARAAGAEGGVQVALSGRNAFEWTGGMGRGRSRENAAAADEHTAKAVRGRHLDSLLNDLAVVVAAIAADHQRLAFEAIKRVEDRLDEVLGIIFLLENRNFLAQARGARLLVAIRIGGDGSCHLS